MKITKVTKTHFETEDGQVFEHPVELDEIPTVKEFQKIYDDLKKQFSPKQDKDADRATDTHIEGV